MSLRSFLIGALLSVSCLSAPVAQEPSASLSLPVPTVTHSRHSHTGPFTRPSFTLTGTGGFTRTRSSYTGTVPAPPVSSIEIREAQAPTTFPSFTGTFPSFTGSFTFPQPTGFFSRRNFKGTRSHHSFTGSFPRPTGFPAAGGGFPAPTGSFSFPFPPQSVAKRQDESDLPTFTIPTGRPSFTGTGPARPSFTGTFSRPQYSWGPMPTPSVEVV